MVKHQLVMCGNKPVFSYYSVTLCTNMWLANILVYIVVKHHDHLLNTYVALPYTGFYLRGPSLCKFCKES